MAYTQENRLISLGTPLGKDVLLLAGFTGFEAMSRLFSFQLDLLQEKVDESTVPVESSDIIGQPVTISVKLADGSHRYINGIVNRFVHAGGDKVFYSYKMEVVPWLWRLTRFSDCKIFHNKEVKEIIQQVFSDRGFSDYRTSLTATYPKLEYCVQYRETDFNFVSRLMEQNGIFYFFEHENGKHTMVIADSASAIQSCPSQKKAGYNLATGNLDDDDVVNSWSLEQELRSGRYTLTDYNFKNPSANLDATERTIVPVGNNSSHELFDYPGIYDTRQEGSFYAKLRMEEEEARHLVARGSSVCRAFATGYKFELTDHTESAMNVSYLLTEIQHIASVRGSYSTNANDNGGESYSNQFVCIPESVPFVPARLTPKPFVQGPQTAVVVGKSQVQNSSDEDDSEGTEDIWVDKYGRVVVKFPWDRAGNCSCRVRVSQEWAGNGWGAITIPRIGQEVIVSFLEGDPDRPIITGRVYNENQTVPYKLPDNQTRSTFKSRSTTGGDDTKYNELRFEDKSGSEQIFLRGQKDVDTRILNDSREWVGNNRSLIVTKDFMEKVKENFHSEVVQNSNQKVGQTMSLQVGQNLYEKSGVNFAHEAGVMIHLKSGANVVIEATAMLTLKVGGSFVVIDGAGVSISGPMVMINSGGSAGDGCGSSPQSPQSPDEADDGSKGKKMN